MVISFIRLPIRKEKGMIMIYIRRIILSLQRGCYCSRIGYFCVEKDFPPRLSVLPYKKKRNQDLSQEEKDYNTIHSKKRIIVEHTVCRLKKYRIMSEV